MKYENIDSVVRDICAFRGDPEHKEYIPVLRVVRRVLHQLQLHIIPDLQSRVYTIEDNLTISLNDDVLDVTKVGVCNNGTGKIRIMGRNDNICKMDLVTEVTSTDAGCTCGSSSKDEQTIEEINDSLGIIQSESIGEYCSLCTFHNYFHGSICKGELYGFRPRMFSNGTFRYDEKSNMILFNSGYDVEAGGKVIVEYNAAFSKDQYKLIPMVAFPVIKARAMQWLLEGTNPNQASYHFDQFMREFKTLKDWKQNFTLEDILASLRGNYQPTPKR